MYPFYAQLDVEGIDPDESSSDDEDEEAAINLKHYYVGQEKRSKWSKKFLHLQELDGKT